MARLTIPDEQTFATFTVVTSTTAFPITFSLFAKADLTVLVDNVALDQSAFTFTGTLLEGGGYDGGTVTLNTAVDDVTVRIERNVAPARTSNFAPASSVPVQSVDQALNRLTANAQDHDRRVADVEAVIDDIGDAEAAAVAAAASAAAAVTSAAQAAAAAGAITASSVRLRTVSLVPVSLASTPSEVGGATLASADLVLLAGQTDRGDNGVYVYSAGTLTRSLAFDTGTELIAGYRFFVTDGHYSGQTFFLETEGALVIGTTDLSFRLGGRAVPRYTRMICLGDSLTESSDFPTTNWVKQIGAVFGLTPSNLGEGGDQLGDRAGAGFNIAPTATDLLTMGLGTNDQQATNSQDTNRRWLIKSGHAALILHMATPASYGERVTADDMSTSAGTWTGMADGVDPTGRFTSNNGAVKRATVSGSSVVILFWLNESLSGEMTVSIDGETFDPIPLLPTTLSGGASVTTDDGETYLPCVLVFDNLADKDHVVSIASTGVEGTFVVVSKVMGFNGETVEGPTLLVANLHDRGAVGWATGGAGVEKRTALFNRAILDNVALANRLGLVRVRLWDWSTSISQDLTLLKADEFHPSQLGHNRLTATGLQVLDQVLLSPDTLWPDAITRAKRARYRGLLPFDQSLMLFDAEGWRPQTIAEIGETLGLTPTVATTPTAVHSGSGSFSITNAVGAYSSGAGFVTATAKIEISAVSSPTGTFFIRLAPESVGVPYLSAINVHCSGLEAAADTMTPQALTFSTGGLVFAQLSMLDGGTTVDFSPFLKVGAIITVSVTYPTA